jgi:hypothetical protein
LNSLGKIPVVYGVLHQAFALLFLTVMLYVNFRLSRHPDEQGKGAFIAVKQTRLDNGKGLAIPRPLAGILLEFSSST